MIGSRTSMVITGASGFLGLHLCRTFAHLGYQVRAVYRRRRPPEELLGLASIGVELVNADLQEAGASERVCENMDIVLHCAALAYDWGPYEQFKRANIDITDDLLTASRLAGCHTFVFLSSAAVHGFGNHVDTHEEGPFFPLRYPYPMTKYTAEQHVLASDRPGFKTVAIRPCNVYGPGDQTSTYSMFAAILDGVFGYIGGGTAYTCPLYIDDFCQGVRLVVESDRLAGEPIILTDGTKVSWHAYTKAMYDAIGSAKHPFSIPKSAAFLAARIMGFGANVLHSRKAPPLTLYRVEQATSNYHFSHEKARRVLGFSPTVFYEEGLALTAEAFLRSLPRS